MITEEELHEYNKWLMEVWNPNQLYIPFAIDAPKAFLGHKSKVKKLSKADVIKSVCVCGAEHSNEAKYIGQCNYCLKQIS